MSGMNSPTETPSGMAALLSAVVVAIGAGMVWPLVEAGPTANFLGPFYPFALLGFGFLAARRGVRTWRALQPTPVSGQRATGMVLAFLGVLVSLGVIAWGLIFVFAMTVGFGIS